MAKVKIIKELPPKFKEIKKDEEEEENLEEEVSEMPEEETFSEFIEGERTAPVLETIPIPDTELLEQELAGVASIPTTDTTRRTDYVTNIPDYGVDYEQAIRHEEIERQERRDREMNVTFAEPRTKSEDEFKKMDVRGWREGMTDSDERDRKIQRDYETLIMKKEGEREGLPFEDKKSRRRLNI